MKGEEGGENEKGGEGNDEKAKGRKGGREKWKRVGSVGKERGKGREMGGRCR